MIGQTISGYGVTWQSWRARVENRFALGVWSREQVLAAGGSARFATSFRIER